MILLRYYGRPNNADFETTMWIFAGLAVIFFAGLFIAMRMKK
ncbi:MAG TPA: hypothetical protein VHM26_14325 [Chitinophagaceae bacterium]|jgi:hypothetical protein|nr:hypothetical protein [Chitinophagaceae bacterium]